MHGGDDDELSLFSLSDELSIAGRSPGCSTSPRSNGVPHRTDRLSDTHLSLRLQSPITGTRGQFQRPDRRFLLLALKGISTSREMLRAQHNGIDEHTRNVARAMTPQEINAASRD